MSGDWTEPIELATHATALIEAIRTGRAVPAGHLLRLELPGNGSPSLEHGRRDCRHWHTAKDHHQLAGAWQAGPQPLPRAATTPLPAVLAQQRCSRRGIYYSCRFTVSA